MGEEEDIASLRARVAELVGKEGQLLNEAFRLSRGKADRRGVDALFAQVQAIQVERCGLKKKIGAALGTRRLHAASEVWKPGIYEYRPAPGAEGVQVRITSEALGLQVHLPLRDKPVRIESLGGSFEGPLAGEEAR